MAHCESESANRLRSASLNKIDSMTHPLLYYYRGDLSITDLVSTAGPSGYVVGSERIGTADEARYFRLSQHQRAYKEAINGVLLDRNVRLAEVTSFHITVNRGIRIHHNPSISIFHTLG